MIKTTQQQVNKVCELLQQQGIEINFANVSKKLGMGFNLEIMHKVMCYKDNPDLASKKAQKECENIYKGHSDELLAIIKKSLTKYENISNSEKVYILREYLGEYLQNEVNESLLAIQSQNNQLKFKNDNLEAAVLNEQARYKALLDKYNKVKEHNYQLSQDVQAKFVNKNNADYANYLDMEEFRDYKEQIEILELKHKQFAVFDSYSSVILLVGVLPNTNVFRELTKGGSPFLKAKAKYSFKLKVWLIWDFESLEKTVEFFRRNKFVISNELESAVYYSKL